MFIWALISEIPFDLANYGKIFYPVHQNIYWTLFLSAIGIHFLEKTKELGLKTLTAENPLTKAWMKKAIKNQNLN